MKLTGRHICESHLKNNVGDDGARAIAAALQKNSSIKSLQYVEMIEMTCIDPDRSSQFCPTIQIELLRDQRRRCDGDCGSTENQHHRDNHSVRMTVCPPLIVLAFF